MTTDAQAKREAIVDEAIASAEEIGRKAWLLGTYLGECEELSDPIDLAVTRAVLIRLLSELDFELGLYRSSADTRSEPATAVAEAACDEGNDNGEA